MEWVAKTLKYNFGCLPGTLSWATSGSKGGSKVTFVKWKAALLDVGVPQSFADMSMLSSSYAETHKWCFQTRKTQCVIGESSDKHLSSSHKHFHTLLLFILQESSWCPWPLSTAVWMGPIRPDSITLTYKQITDNWDHMSRVCKNLGEKKTKPPSMIKETSS